jgi:hypothetical protein
MSGRIPYCSGRGGREYATPWRHVARRGGAARGVVEAGDGARPRRSLPAPFARSRSAPPLMARRRFSPAVGPVARSPVLPSSVPSSLLFSPDVAWPGGGRGTAQPSRPASGRATGCPRRRPRPVPAAGTLPGAARRRGRRPGAAVRRSRTATLRGSPRPAERNNAGVDFPVCTSFERFLVLEVLLCRLRGVGCSCFWWEVSSGGVPTSSGSVQEPHAGRRHGPAVGPQNVRRGSSSPPAGGPSPADPPPPPPAAARRRPGLASRRPPAGSSLPGGEQASHKADRVLHPPRPTQAGQRGPLAQSR